MDAGFHLEKMLGWGGAEWVEITQQEVPCDFWRVGSLHFAK